MGMAFAAKEISPLDPTTYLTHLTGKRFWFLISSGPDFYYLRSLNTPHEWPYKKPFVSHKTPNLDCHYSEYDNEYGIHSYKMDYRFFGAVLNGILGTVNIWGKIIEHEYGYRSEYAYPLELLGSYCFTCGSYLALSMALMGTTFSLPYFMFFCSKKCLNIRLNANAEKDNIMKKVDANKILDMLQLSYGLEIK